MFDQLLIILNEIILLVLALGVMSFTLTGTRKSDGRAEIVATVLVLAVLSILVAVGQFPDGQAFGGTYSSGPVERIFKSLFLLSGALTALLSWPARLQSAALLPRDRIGEHLGLMLLSIIGMCFLVCAKELLLLYVSLELVTIPLILLVAFNRHELRSTEAAIKYVMFSALSSGALLYGLSLVYGMAGTTQLAALAVRLSPSLLTIVALTLVTAGVGFKISAVPFHLWTPDTYEGAPLPVAAFLSVASKAAGFALFYKIITLVFQNVQGSALVMTAVLATVTMTLGNLIALYQTNLKRFLAFSSIAQAGYLMIGLTDRSELGLSSVTFYLLVYLVSNLAAFGVVTLVASATGKEDMRDYVGFSMTNPKLAAVMMLAMFSLAGIPPLAGFLGKFYLFAAAAEQGLYWLVLVGAVNATISLYYYLIVLKWMYLIRVEPGQPQIDKIQVPLAGQLVLLSTAAGMLFIGNLPQVIRWAESAATAGF